MLAVALFVAFWIVLALVVFLIAGSGGPGGARHSVQTSSYRGGRGLALILVFTYVAFGVAIPLVFLAGNHSKANAQVGGIKLTASEKTGREVFAFRCGFCHTLAAANTTGKVGPNLDVLKPPESLVLSTIANGCLQSPPTPNSPQACLGQGNMPAGIIQGTQAQDVASFVAKVAGRE